MTGAGKIRMQVYFGALVFLLAPLWILLTLSGTTGWSFGPFAALLLIFLVASRWDILGYWLEFVFLIALLVIAYQSGKWPLVAIAVGEFLILQAIFRGSSREKAIELSFPLLGGTYYIAHGGASRLLNHHAAVKSQAYALDIVRLNWLGTRAAGIYPRQLRRYAIFGDAVYSPCAAIVTTAINNLPELAPGEMDRRHPAGNHLVLQVEGTDIYIGLAHLMQGSVMVQPGNRVRAGQMLARVGNSGNTSEPHLHIHAKRGGSATSILDGEGVPLRFGGRWLIRNGIVLAKKIPIAASAAASD